ncbi:MAG: hypothetical protein RW306_11185 [Geobacteraceae bacterium]|nr:hypothetical protein [Geobacteraceae bacterium]
MNKEKARPMEMLVVDDDIKYAEALNREAQNMRIILKHATNLEDAKKIMESRFGNNISGVILDVVCMKERSQKIADNSFIIAASGYFREKAPHLPVVVITGEPDQYTNLKELFKGTLAVYSKGSEEDVMLTFLKEEAGKVDRNKIINQYKDVFETLEKYLGNDAVDELLTCLRMMSNSDSTSIKNSLACLRRLQEKIYIALNRISYKFIPTELVEGEVKVSAIHRHLVEKGITERNKIVDRFAELIYKISCDHGAHTPTKTPKYVPSQYTVQSLTFALLDLILWMKSTADEMGI